MTGRSYICYPRFARSRLEEALSDTPVVLVHGPHQCVETNLACMVGDAAGYEYTTFKDDMKFHLVQAGIARFN
jgi:hypothetical protein